MQKEKPSSPSPVKSTHLKGNVFQFSLKYMRRSTRRDRTIKSKNAGQQQQRNKICKSHLAGMKVGILFQKVFLNRISSMGFQI